MLGLEQETGNSMNNVLNSCSGIAQHLEFSLAINSWQIAAMDVDAEHKVVKHPKADKSLTSLQNAGGSNAGRPEMTSTSACFVASSAAI